MNAFTGQKLADLKYMQWDKLGELMADKMRQQNFGQWLKNKWTEVTSQYKMDYMSKQENLMDTQIDLNILKFDKMMRDSFGDFLDFDIDF